MKVIKEAINTLPEVTDKAQVVMDPVEAKAKLDSDAAQKEAEKQGAIKAEDAIKQEPITGHKKKDYPKKIEEPKATLDESLFDDELDEGVFDKLKDKVNDFKHRNDKDPSHYWLIIDNQTIFDDHGDATTAYNTIMDYLLDNVPVNGESIDMGIRYNDTGDWAIWCNPGSFDENPDLDLKQRIGGNDDEMVQDLEDWYTNTYNNTSFVSQKPWDDENWEADESLDESLTEEITEYIPGAFGLEFIGIDAYLCDSEEAARAEFDQYNDWDDLESDCDGIVLFKVLDSEGNTEIIAEKDKDWTSHTLVVNESLTEEEKRHRVKVSQIDNMGNETSSNFQDLTDKEIENVRRYRDEFGRNTRIEVQDESLNEDIFDDVANGDYDEEETQFSASIDDGDQELLPIVNELKEQNRMLAGIVQLSENNPTVDIDIDELINYIQWDDSIRYSWKKLHELEDSNLIILNSDNDTCKLVAPIDGSSLKNEALNEGKVNEASDMTRFSDAYAEVEGAKDYSEAKRVLAKQFKKHNLINAKFKQPKVGSPDVIEFTVEGTPENIKAYKQEFAESLNEGKEIVAISELAKAAKNILFTQPWKAKEILTNNPSLVRDFIESGLSAEDYFQKECDYYGAKRYADWFGDGCPTKFVKNYMDESIKQVQEGLSDEITESINKYVESFKAALQEEYASIPEFIEQDMQNGNAFWIMGYCANAMQECGLSDEIEQMRDEAMASDYDNLCTVCDSYIQRCNQIADDYDDEFDYDIDTKDIEDLDDPDFYNELVALGL